MTKPGCGCNKHKEELIIIPKRLEMPDNWDIPDFIEDDFPIHPCPEKPLVVVLNLADEEDITVANEKEKSVLKFKNKEYIPSRWSGLGRVFLRKNLVDTSSPDSCGIRKVNVLTLEMFQDEVGDYLTDTIFIVLYDYDLQGRFITIPSDSILLFLGGSFNHGTIILQNTLVLPQLINFEQYLNCNVKGTYKSGQSFYTESGIKFWNGENWITLNGTEDSLLEELLESNRQIKDTLSCLEENLGDLSLYVTTDKLVTINNQSLISDGEHTNIEIAFPIATSDDLGLVKVGYTQEGDNFPVKADNEGNLYVYISSEDSDNIKTSVYTLLNDFANMQTAVLSKLDWTSADLNFVSKNSILNTDKKTIKSSFLSECVFKTDLDSAVAELLALDTTNETKALILALVQGGMSSIKLSADLIDVLSILTKITTEEVVFPDTSGNNRTISFKDCNIYVNSGDDEMFTTVDETGITTRGPANDMLNVYKGRLTNHTLVFSVDDTEVLNFGPDENYTGQLVIGGVTLTVKGGLIVSYQNDNETP